MPFDHASLPYYAAMLMPYADVAYGAAVYAFIFSPPFRRYAKMLEMPRYYCLCC